MNKKLLTLIGSNLSIAIGATHGHKCTYYPKLQTLKGLPVGKGRVELFGGIISLNFPMFLITGFLRYLS
ncbi:hypothetical protein [Mongoliitalea daihaiensis]|uniref:hypothetical protein n=1 Tax=Mongoliitalea daihaiensis TaxID=2782006 RepID=UPI001F3C1E6A|nr:hypothetical protein [Mongoliitalea daihaiensis]UJP64405.1 hypothetical protein IPZ59_16585 [Mongoliitalea daihaiensis]